MNKIVRSTSEIEAVYGEAMNAESEGSKFSGMTYEQGIIAMLDWLTGRTDSNPMED